MDEKRNDKRQKGIIILLLLLILFLLVFIVILLLRKPTVIEQNNQPKNNNTQEVITDDKSKSSDQTKDDTDKEEDKKVVVKPVTPKKEEEKKPTPTPTPTPTPDPTPEKTDGKIEKAPVSKGPADSKLTWEDGVSHPLVDAGESSTGTMMYCVTEYPSTITGTFSEDIPEMSDAGHYYVWYYSKGDSTHNDTAIDKVEVWIKGEEGKFHSPEVSTNLVYDGFNKDLFKALAKYEDGDVYYAVKNDNTTTPSIEDFKVEKPQGKDAGTYYIWYFARGTGKFDDFYDEKTEGKYFIISVNIDKGNSDHTNPTAKTDLKEKDTAQALINAGTTTSAGCKFYYGLGTNDTEPTSYSETIPTGTTAGTYYVWWYLDGGTNYESTSHSKITVTIQAKANYAKCVKPTKVDNLKYSKGASLTLINPGSAYDGDVQTGVIRYVVTDNTVQEAPPASPANYPFTGDSHDGVTANSYLPKGIDAGTYRVWYYVDGIGEYDDNVDSSYYIDVPVDQIQGNVVFAPTAKSPLYATGEPQVLLDTSKLSKSFTLEYSIDNKQIWSEDVPTGTEAKTYTVWYRTKETNNYTSSDPVSISVKIDLPYATLDVAPTAIPGVVYTEGTPAKIAKEGNSTTGKIKYALINVNQVMPVGEITFYDEIPLASLGHVLTGEYRLEYYIEPDENHQEYPGGDGGRYGHNTLTLFNLKLYSSPATFDPEPTAIEGIVEDGFEHELVVPGTSSTGIVKYAVFTEEVADTSTIEDSEFTNQVPTAKDQGTYHIYYYAGEGGQYGRSSIGHLEVTINYPRATFTTLPTAKSGVKYNGLKQTVANKGTAPGTAAIMYAITTEPIAPEKVSSGDVTGWTLATIPDAIYGTHNIVCDAGTYYLWAYVQHYHDSSANKDYSDSEMVCVSCVIEKSEPSYVKAEPIYSETIEYNGQEKDLFTGLPTTNDGTIMYFISKGSATDVTQNTDFYKSISKDTLDKKIYNDKYYVYYYIKGDKNHEDSGFKGPYEIVIDGDDPYYLNQPTGQNKVWPSVDQVEQFEILDDTHKGSIIEGKQDLYAIKYAVTTEFVQPNYSEFRFYDEIDFTRTQMGTYYIWFYIAAKDGSSILPADGAGGVSYTTSTIGIEASFASTPKLINYMENDNTVVLYESGSFIPYSNGTSTTGTIYYALTSGENSDASRPNDSVFTPSLPSISDIGEYTLWSFVKGTNGYSNSSEYNQLSFEVHRRAVIKTHPTLVENTSLDNAPFSPIATEGTSDDGKVLYNVRYYLDKAPQSDEISHFFEANHEKNKISDLGKRYVYYGVSSDTKYIENSEVYKLLLTPEKKKGFANVPPKSKGVVQLGNNYGVEVLDLAQEATGEVSYAYTTIEGLEPPTSSFVNTREVYVYAPGTYYLWYRIDESYDGMYGALEPTYIGSVEVQGNGPVVTPPTPNTELIYNGEAQPALLAPAQTSAGNIYYYLTTAGYGLSIDYMTTEIPTITRPGDYRVYYMSRGIGNNENSNQYYVDITMEKAERENTISPQGLTLQYNKESQQLIEAPFNNDESINLEYMIGPGDGSEPTSGTWGTLSSIRAKEPGIYYVWYRAAEDELYKASKASYVIATIKEQARIEIEPQVDMIKYIYGGSPINPLSVEGYSSAGTVMYAYSTDKAVTPELSEFKEDLLISTPNEGREFYYIFYYVKSNNALYYDSDVYSPLEFKFNKKSLEFTKAPSFVGAETSGKSIVIHKASTYTIIPGVINEPEHGDIRYAILTFEEVDGQKLSIFLEQDIWHTADDSTLFNAISSTGDYALLYRADPKSGDDAYYQAPIEPGCVYITVQSERETFNPEFISDTNYEGSPIALVKDAPMGVHGGEAFFALGEDDVHAPDTVLFTQNIPSVNEPGTYYVWYFAGKTEGYAESIKQCHTVTISDGIWSYVIPEVSAAGGRYTGNAIQLVEQSSPESQTAGTMRYAQYPYPAVAPDKGGMSITDANAVTGIEPGKYIIYYYYDLGGGDTTDIKYVTSEITKGECSFVDINFPRSVEYIQFDDNWHDLVLDPISSNSSYDIYYICTEDDINPTYDDFNDTTKPNKGASGTYHIWWYAKCNDGRYEDSLIHSFDVTIGKTAGFIGKEAAAPDGKPQVKNSIYANGVKQEVLDTTNGVPFANGNTYEGLMYYVAGFNETNIDKSKFTKDLPTIKDAGRYYLYYYAPESPYHYETDIYSIEFNVERPNINFNMPGVNYLEYRPNDKQPVFWDSGYIAGEIPGTSLHLAYAFGTETTHPADEAFSPEQPYVSYAGTYYIYMFVANDYGYRVSDYQMQEVTVQKMQTEKIGGFDIPDFLINQNIVEDGELHNVFTADAPQIIEELKKKTNRDSICLMYYLTTEDGYYEYCEYPPKYLFDQYIPGVNEPQVLGAGVYYLYSYAKGDGNNEDSYITFKSFKVQEGTDTLPSAKRGLVYNGMAQSLIEPGETNLGTYVYALSDGFSAPSVNDYSEDIPSATNAAGGFVCALESYEVYYKKIYSNGEMSNPQILYVDIEQKLSSFSQKAKAYEKVVYSGQAQDVIETPAISASAKDGMVYYILFDHEPDLTNLVSAATGDPSKDGTDFLTYLIKCQMASVDPTQPPKLKDAGKHYLAYTVFPQYVLEEFLYLAGQGNEPVVSPEDTNYTCLLIDLAKYTVGIDPSCFEVFEIDVLKQDMDITDPVGLTATWTGTPVDLVTPGSADQGEIQYAVTYENVEPAIELFSNKAPQATNMGTYYVWWYAKANDPDGMYSDSEIKCVTAQITGDGPVITRPTAKTDLKYNGELQDVLENLPTTLEEGTFKYCVTMDIPTSVPVSFDTATPQAKESGTHYVWYYLDGTKSTAPEYITVNIGKGEVKVTKNPELKDPSDILVFNDGAGTSTYAPVLTPGEVTNGTFMYALVRSKKGVPPVEPKLNAYGSTEDYYSVNNTNTYYVYCYVKGDEGYEDTAPVCLGSVHATDFNPYDAMNTARMPDPLYGLTTNGGKVKLTNGDKVVSMYDGSEIYGAEFRYYVHKYDETPFEQVVNEAPLEEFYKDGDYATEPGDYIVVVGMYNSLTDSIYFKDYGNRDAAAYSVHVDIGSAGWEVEPAANPTPTLTYNEGTQTYEVNLLKEGTAVPAKEGLNVTYLVSQGKDERIPDPSDVLQANCIVYNQTGWFTVYALIHGDGTTVNDSEIYKFYIYVEPLANEILVDPSINGQGNPITIDWTGEEITLLEDTGKTKASENGGDIYFYVSRFATAPILSKSSDEGWIYGLKAPILVKVKDVGKYYLWYYAAGNELYGETELKSIEINIVGSGPSVTVTEPNTNIKYDGTEYALFGSSHSIFTTPFSATADYNVKYYVNNDINNVPKPADYVEYGSADFERNKGSKIFDAGTYYLWFYADDGSGNTTDVTKMRFDVEKADITNFIKPVIYDNIVFRGDTQIAQKGIAQNGVVKYYVGDTNATPTVSQFESLSQNENKLKVYNPGDYYLWYLVEGDMNHNNIEPTLLGQAHVDYMQHKTSNPSGQIYIVSEGMKVMLIEPGKAVGKERFRYLLGDDSFYNFKTINELEQAIPREKWPVAFTPNDMAYIEPTQEKTYYVWYLIENSDGSFSEPECVITYVLSEENAPVVKIDPVSADTGQGYVSWNGADPMPVNLLKTLAEPGNENTTFEYAVTIAEEQPEDKLFKQCTSVDDESLRVNEPGRYYVWFRAVNNGVYERKDNVFVEVVDEREVGNTYYVHLPSTSKTVEVPSGAENFSLLKIIGETKPGYTLLYYATKDDQDNGRDLSKYTIYPPTVNVSDNPAGEWFIYYRAVNEDNNLFTVDGPQKIDIKVEVSGN